MKKYHQHNEFAETARNPAETVRRAETTKWVETTRRVVSTLILFLFISFLISSVFAQSPDDKNIRVLLAEPLNNCKISSDSGFMIRRGDNQLKCGGTEINICADGGKFIIADERNKEILSGGAPAEICPQDGRNRLKFNGAGYRGCFIISFQKNSFRVINRVKLNEYLYGVLPKELKTQYEEALKAQAVISRTFALSRMGKNKNNDFDVYDDLRDQAYAGLDIEDPKINEVIDGTKGMVLTYNGKLAGDLFYHSACGGVTASNSDLFLNDPVPYLSPVVCTLESFLSFMKNKNNAGAGQTPANSNNVGATLAVALSDKNQLKEPLCKKNKFFTWEAIVSAEDVLNNLPKHSAKRADEIENIIITSKSKYGRVVEIKITGKMKNIFTRGNRIRWILAFKDDKCVKQILYSTNFDIFRDENKYTIDGKGWGHGVGLCQTGALKLASMGATFEDILEFYYRGTKVSKE